MSIQVAADKTAKSSRKRTGGPSVAERKLMLTKEIVSREIAPPCTVPVKNLAPNYRGPNCEQVCANLGTRLKLPPFEPKPKMAMGVDIGQRRIGLAVGWSRSARDPLVLLYIENINGFPNHPISVEYLHRVNNTHPLPEGVDRWDDVNTLESAMQQDMIDDLHLRNRIANFVKDAPVQAQEGAIIKKRSPLTVLQLKQHVLETFYDTTQDLNYMPNRTMDHDTFQPIPKGRTEIGNWIRDTMTVYARYLRETYGKMDVIFLEEQNIKFGIQGERDQESTKVALERYFPRPETRYRDLSGAVKLNMFPFSCEDVARLDHAKLWKPKHFSSLGPSGRLALLEMEVPVEHRHVLEKYRNITDDMLNDEKVVKVPYKETVIGKLTTGAKRPTPAISAATLHVPPAPSSIKTKKRPRSEILNRIDKSLTMLNDDNDDEAEPEAKRGCLDIGRFGASTDDQELYASVEADIDAFGVATNDCDLNEGEEEFGSWSDQEEDDDDDVLAPIPGISNTVLPLMNDIYRNGCEEFSVEFIMKKFDVREPK